MLTRLRLKQNRYPVLFLTQGVTSKYPEYNDPRTRNTSVAINFALFAGILGLNMHTEDILRDPSLVKDALSHGLITFCWGDENNSAATIKYMKKLGLNGVIYDRIEEHIEQKQSVFLSDDGSDLLHIASCLSPCSTNEDSFSQFPGSEDGHVSNGGVNSNSVLEQKEGPGATNHNVRKPATKHSYSLACPDIIILILNSKFSGNSKKFWNGNI